MSQRISIECKINTNKLINGIADAVRVTSKSPDPILLHSTLGIAKSVIDSLKEWLDELADDHEQIAQFVKKLGIHKSVNKEASEIDMYKTIDRSSLPDDAKKVLRDLFDKVKDNVDL